MIETIYSQPLEKTTEMVKSSSESDQQYLSMIFDYQSSRQNFAKDISYQNLSSENEMEVKLEPGFCGSEELNFSNEIVVKNVVKKTNMKQKEIKEKEKQERKLKKEKYKEQGEKKLKMKLDSSSDEEESEGEIAEPNRVINNKKREINSDDDNDIGGGRRRRY